MKYTDDEIRKRDERNGENFPYYERPTKKNKEAQSESGHNDPLTKPLLTDLKFAVVYDGSVEHQSNNVGPETFWYWKPWN